MFGTSVKTGKTLVTIVAAAADPTGLVVAGAVLDTVIHTHDELAKKHPDLGTLAKDAQKKFDDALKTPFYDKPDDARILLPQMLEQAWEHANFAGTGLNASKILDAMLAALPAGPDIREEHRTAFRNLFGPILKSLCDNPRLTAVISPQLWQEKFRRDDDLKADVAEVLRILRGNKAAETAPTEVELQKLAIGFGASDVSDPKQLIAFLTLKAEELKNLKAEMEQVRRTYPRLDNKISEALRLLDEGQANTDEVRRIVHEARRMLHDGKLREALEENAKLAELEARALLLDGKVDEAATILTAGADALGVIDPLAPARKKAFQFQIILYNHGLRFGGRGLACALAMVEDALETLTRETVPQDWAGAQNNLAIDLEALAIRSDGEEATSLLIRAIAAYENALIIFTRADLPEDWASAQQNLANALATLATRSDREQTTAMLTRAIAAYEEALTVFTRTDHPANWATTQQNLAIALQTLAISRDKDEATAVLTLAIEAFEEALTVFTRADNPANWATTQQNLAIALAALASRSEGEMVIALLNRANAAFEQALTVRTGADHPANRAITQENMAILHYTWSQHPNCTDKHAYLEKALTHIDAALTVYDSEHMPYYHSKATHLRDALLSALSAL